MCIESSLWLKKYDKNLRKKKLRNTNLVLWVFPILTRKGESDRSPGKARFTKDNNRACFLDFCPSHHHMFPYKIRRYAFTWFWSVLSNGGKESDGNYSIKKLRRLLQRKRHFKIALSGKLSVFQSLFHVFQDMFEMNQESFIWLRQMVFMKEIQELIDLLLFGYVVRKSHLKFSRRHFFPITSKKCA